METLLIVAAEFIALAFIIIVVFDFLTGLAHLWKSVAPATQVEPEPETPQPPGLTVNSLQCRAQPETQPNQ